MKTNSKDPYRQAQDTAIALLARRLHSRAEIRRKLAERGFEARIVEKVLSACEQLRYIDDETTADFFVQELLRKRVGLLRIRDAMKEKGFAGELIDRMVDRHRVPDIEMEIAGAALEKKRAALFREKDHRKRREKAARFLRSRGFRSSTISALLANIEDIFSE